MSLKYNLIILCLFGSFYLRAAVPEDLVNYIKDMQKMSYIIHENFQGDQFDKIINQMGNLLESLFEKSIKKTANYQRSELDSLLKNHYLESPPKSDPYNRLDQTPKWATDDKVVKLMKGFQGKIENGLLNLKYDNQTIPFMISVKDNFLHMKMLGASLLPNYVNFCLELDIFAPNIIDARTKVKWLGSGETACPFVAKKPGTFLLIMAENFARVLSNGSLQLRDESTVRCRENSEKVDFRTLRIFQTGKSWYESLGYSPLYRNEKMAYNLAVNNLVKKSLSDIINDVDKNVDKLEPRRIVFEDAVKKYKLKHVSTDLFSHFMTWLYSENCADYLSVYGLVVSDKKFIKAPEVQDLEKK